jgi:hypothetical protein
MPDFEQNEFKFPDEQEETAQPVEDQIEIEIVDDTPEEEKAHIEPMPKEIVNELEQDELEAYSKEAKKKLKQLKKVWNDERRRADAAEKDREEIDRLAKAIMEENQRLKGQLSQGQQSLVESHKENAQKKLDDAKREYKDAYDSGDGERLVEAQERLTEAKLEARRLEEFKPQQNEDTLQSSQSAVQSQNQPQRLDAKTQAWLDKNQWYGKDDDMSYLAHGVHRRLEREGVPIGSDHYWATIDEEVRRRFPEKFQGEGAKSSSDKAAKSADNEAKTSKKNSKPATVVAPATRSTSPKRVTLTPRQVQLAKKYNLTPEQYARELMKLESQNG